MANEANPCPCDIGDRLDYGSLGQEVQIEHINGYVVKPTTTSEKAIIVIQDIYGWKLPNTRYMADMLASNGYILFFGKEPWSASHDWSKFQEWLEDKKATNIKKEVDATIKFLKDKCGAKQIGVVGFCWGGIATHYIALQYPEIKAGVSVYGIIRLMDDKYDLKSPTLETSLSALSIVQVNSLQARLKEECKVDYQVKIFPGQSHGFVHRKRQDINSEDKHHIQEARRDMLNWFNKYM
uniref:Carboxymethylenebutenolidase homolog n=1 Tax=Neogobius melanostomus TaxID=47308 RepID=A0A8C6WUK1_9GOBI